MGLEGRLFRPGHPTSVTSQKQPTGYSCRRTLQWIADRNERSQGANYPLESNEGTRGGRLRVGNSQGPKRSSCDPEGRKKCFVASSGQRLLIPAFLHAN